MEKYLVRDWRFDNAVMVELSDEEVSVLSYFLNWADLTDVFSISNVEDIAHVNWHGEYSIVEDC